MPPRSQAHIAFGEAVREIRKKQGLTQQEVSEAMGAPATFISDIERGVRNPSWSTILALAEAMKVKPSEIAARAEK
jgi:transcriptional regulator with XRE-family HTH domain